MKISPVGEGCKTLCGMFKTYRALTAEERIPGEEIRDEAIVNLARSGNMLTAIRLYRTKY